MDRAIVYPLEQLKAIDVCRTNLFSMIGAGKLTKAILGSGPLLNDLDCVPDSPASLDVFLNPGEIYILEDIDTTAYGPIPADNTHQIIKQGILLDSQSFTLTPPSTPGESINYLIQITYSDSDTNVENRPYFGGPAQNVSTVRSGLLVSTLKAGTAAPTGTQVTPTPDVGYVGAWVITVANGQTQIIAGDITAYTNAPFITEKLVDKISQAFADGRYGQITQIQAGSYLYAIDSGSVNSLVASITPNITSLYVGMEAHIKVANTNTGACTINLNSLGVKNIKNMAGFQLSISNLIAGMTAILYYDGTDFILTNPLSIPVAFRAILSADIVVPASVVTLIDFNTIQTNVNSDFDTSTGKFTVQTAGIYKITASLQFAGDSTGGGNTKCSIYKNSTEVSANDVSTFDTSAVDFSSNPICEYIGELSIGDIVEVYGFLNLNSRTVRSGSVTYFQGYRIL